MKINYRHKGKWIVLQTCKNNNFLIIKEINEIIEDVVNRCDWYCKK